MAEAARADETMTVDEFLTWAETVEGKWELIGGIPAQMQSEANAHTRAKQDIIRQLDPQLEGGGCEAVVDGVSVKIGDAETQIPDALVECGSPDPLSTLADEPSIVFEVTSDRTRGRDYGDKRRNYARAPSIGAIVIIDLQALTAELSIPHDSRDGSCSSQSFVPPGVMEIPLQGGLVRIDLERIFRRAGVWPPMKDSASEGN